MSENVNEAREFLVGAIDAATGVLQLAKSSKDWLIERLIADDLISRGLMDESERFNPVTPRALADALNRKIFAEYGIDVGDLLDSESVKRAMKKEALRVVGERLGVEGGAAAIAQALKSQVRSELIAAARDGDGELLAAIGVGERAIADAVRTANVNNESQQVRNTTQAGEKNRERQARYRAAHKRVWVAR